METKAAGSANDYYGGWDDDSLSSTCSFATDFWPENNSAEMAGTVMTGSKSTVISWEKLGCGFGNLPLTPQLPLYPPLLHLICRYVSDFTFIYLDVSEDTNSHCSTG